MKHPVTDVFFDLDHTLWDFDTNSRLAFEKLFTVYALRANLEHFLSHYERINHEYWKLYRDEKISSEDLRFHRLKDTFEAVGQAWDAQLVENLSQDYLVELTQNHHLIAGSLEVLNYLKDKYRLHIITNGFEAVQHKKIEGAGIDGYFSTITTSEKAGAKKPHATIFEHAVDSAQTQKSKSVMIGDNFEADIDGALQYGMQAVFFGVREQALHNGVAIVKELVELKNLL